MSFANTTTITVAAYNLNKKAIFKNCTPFADYIGEVNSKQIDNAKDMNEVMLMYNLTEYSYNF